MQATRAHLSILQSNPLSKHSPDVWLETLNDAVRSALPFADRRQEYLNAPVGTPQSTINMLYVVDGSACFNEVLAFCNDARDRLDEDGFSRAALIALASRCQNNDQWDLVHSIAGAHAGLITQLRHCNDRCDDVQMVH